MTGGRRRAEQAPADLLLVGGSVRTPAGPDAGGAPVTAGAPAADRPPAPSGVAVRAGRIVAVGSDRDLRGWLGPATEVVHLDGRCVLPGFHDAHVHPAGGGLERNRCDLTASRSAADYQQAVARYAAARPDREWVLGGGWFLEAFPGGNPTAALLDAVVPDRPVFLPNRDHHSAWVNTAALRRAGVDRHTPDPPDGRIERDAAGRPTGALHDGAMDLVGRLVPATGRAEIEAALLTAQAYLHSLGIVGWQDALVGSALGMPDPLDAYLALTADGRLTAQVVGALWWDRHRGLEQVDGLLERRERARAAGFRAGTVKIMQDGVVETFTAAVLDSYRDGRGRPTGRHGTSFVDPAELAGAVTRLDAEGFQVHVHALGDRAVRETLDAFAAAQAANGRTDHRHHIAHLQIVHPDDLPRFAALGVTANAQPLWACNEPQMVELTLPFLSAEAAAHQYPFGALRRSGARLAFGSDWPVSDPNPLAGMHVAVHRTVPPDPALASWAAGAEPFLPAQALGAAEALGAATLGSAWLNHAEGETGTVEVGKRADLAVVDVDPVAEPDAIAAARVELTLVGGRRVFGDL